MCIHIHIKVYASLCLVWKSSFPHSSVQQKVAPPNNEKILKRRICVMGPSSSKVVGTWCWCIYQCQFLNGITATVYIYMYFNLMQYQFDPIWESYPSKSPAELFSPGMHGVQLPTPPFPARHLLRTIEACSQTASAFEPLMPLERKSISSKWLSLVVLVEVLVAQVTQDCFCRPVLWG